ncbi:hypothetical protein SANTM175S_04506 [Streptomyces antimycoticus]
MEEQRPRSRRGLVRSQGPDAAHHDQMVAARVHGVDRAVDPRRDVRETR